MPADPDELLDAHLTLDNDVVLQFHVTGQVDVIGNYDVVPEFAVVGYVRVGHQQALLTDPGDAGRGSAPVDGHVFPNGSAITDLGQGVLSAKLQVLGNRGDDRPGKNTDVPANPGAGVNGDIRPDLRALPDLDIFLNGGKRSNGDTGSDLGVWVDDAQGMNGHESG